MSKVGKQKIREFIEELSSSKPAPGGGAAAALGGSMAASLVEMVAALTIKKKGYEKVASRMKYLTREAKKHKQRLLRLVDEDTDAYNQVVEAYKLLKEDKERETEIQNALKAATDVPLETAEISKAVLRLAEEVLKKGNKSALSDAKAAKYLAQAVIKSALENVSINLNKIKDMNYRKRIDLVVARIKTN